MKHEYLTVAFNKLHSFVGDGFPFKIVSYPAHIICHFLTEIGRMEYFKQFLPLIKIFEIKWIFLAQIFLDVPNPVCEQWHLHTYAFQNHIGGQTVVLY